MSSITQQILYSPAAGGSVPQTFPKLPDEVRGQPDKYLSWLARQASTNPDPRARSYAAAQYKRELHARRQESDSVQDSSERQINEADLGAANADAVKAAAFTTLAMLPAARAAAALGPTLAPAMRAFLGAMGPGLRLGASADGAFLAGSSGGTMALSGAQIDLLAKAGMITTAVAAMLKGQAGHGRLPPDDPPPRTPTQIDEGKLDYLFGKAGRTTPNAGHNVPRSLGNAAWMKRLGIPDTPAGRELLRGHFEEVVNDSSNIAKTYTNQYGTFEIRESLFQGPSGQWSKLESSWQVLADGTRKFCTLIPYGGG